MVDPVSSANQLHANNAPKPAVAPKTQPTQHKSTPLPSDIVTLKSTGSADNGSGNH
jgi:hypothetical protein